VPTGSMWMSSSLGWRLVRRPCSLSATSSIHLFASPWTSLLHQSSTTIGRRMVTPP
jgi:hypothetical protein